MELVKPAFGLLFWMVITFLTLFFILSKFAWKPILSMISEREKTIEESLNEANKARAEMSQLVARNEELLNQAREERNKILHDAKEAAEYLKTDILARAQKEAEDKMQSAFREIDVQKRAAIAEVKNSVGLMALEIAGKVLRTELKNNDTQVAYVNKLAAESKLNDVPVSSN